MITIHSSPRADDQLSNLIAESEMRSMSSHLAPGSLGGTGGVRVLLIKIHVSGCSEWGEGGLQWAPGTLSS